MDQVSKLITSGKLTLISYTIEKSKTCMTTLMVVSKVPNNSWGTMVLGPNVVKANINIEFGKDNESVTLKPSLCEIICPKYPGTKITFVMSEVAYSKEHTTFAVNQLNDCLLGILNISASSEFTYLREIANYDSVYQVESVTASLAI